MIFMAPLRVAVRSASWFAALGEPLTEGDVADATAYAGTGHVGRVASWPEAEAFLKSPTASLDWWDREEALRKELLARAERQYPERALWTSLTELTTEASRARQGRDRRGPRGQCAGRVDPCRGVCGRTGGLPARRRTDRRQ
jgi:hypothetical protein